MLTINIHGEIIARLEDIVPRLRAEFGVKFEELIAQLHAKAVANFPGATEGEITYGVEVQGATTLIGFIEPTTAKTGAQEFGGKGWYDIPVGSKGFLANPMDKSRYPSGFFSPKDVLHPPMVGKHYIVEVLQLELPWLESELAKIKVEL